MSYSITHHVQSMVYFCECNQISMILVTYFDYATSLQRVPTCLTVKCTRYMSLVTRWRYRFWWNQWANHWVCYTQTLHHLGLSHAINLVCIIIWYQLSFQMKIVSLFILDFNIFLLCFWSSMEHVIERVNSTEPKCSSCFAGSTTLMMSRRMRLRKRKQR